MTMEGCLLFMCNGAITGAKRHYLNRTLAGGSLALAFVVTVLAACELSLEVMSSLLSLSAQHASSHLK